jgi:GMP synthase (glutamine-hydrolysing)
MSPRVLVVEHQASCPPHLVGRWLEDAGCTLSVSQMASPPTMLPA